MASGNIQNAVCQSPDEHGETLQILFAPVLEHSPGNAFSGRVDNAGHFFAGWRYDSFADASIGSRRSTFYKTQLFKFGDLPADGGMIASDKVSQVRDTDGAFAGHHEEQRKQSAIEGNPGLPDHRSIALRTVHDPDDIDKRAMDDDERIIIVCVRHVLLL
jgi:hypothetical protein